MAYLGRVGTKRNPGSNARGTDVLLLHVVFPLAGWELASLKKPLIQEGKNPK
jgi:hypothetical protein